MDIQGFEECVGHHAYSIDAEMKPELAHLCISHLVTRGRGGI